ncbi:MAG: GTPase ObgE, partial [Methylococcaceae bacterium]|nr:GTPase ObgE [Methylococcaceae bacterium]
GVIEGAAEGAGLGLQFLKHLSRTSLLLHVVDIEPYESAESPVEAARKIIREVEKWSDDLANKPRWLVLNKIDRVLDEELDERCQAIVDALGWVAPVFKIAAVNGEGTRELMYAIMNFIEEQRRADSEQQG